MGLKSACLLQYVSSISHLRDMRFLSCKDVAELTSRFLIRFLAHSVQELLIHVFIESLLFRQFILCGPTYEFHALAHSEKHNKYEIRFYVYSQVSMTIFIIAQ